MRNAMSVSVLALALMVAGSSALQAQTRRVATFGVLGGATIPTGSTAEWSATGYNLGVTVGFVPDFLPIGIRIDGTWHEMGLEPTDGNLRLVAGAASAQIQLPIPFGPYVIGGVGMYNTRLPTAAGDQNELGWNAGAGMRFQLAGFATFAEARLHRFSLDFGRGHATLVPVSVGVLF